MYRPKLFCDRYPERVNAALAVGVNCKETFGDELREASNMSNFS